MAYTGKSWAFTKEGLDSANTVPGIGIPASKLTETADRDGVEFYDCLLQVAEMDDAIDLEEFIDAYAEALTRYEGAYAPPPDRAILKRTIAEAREIRKRRH